MSGQFKAKPGNYGRARGCGSPGYLAPLFRKSGKSEVFPSIFFLAFRPGWFIVGLQLGGYLSLSFGRARRVETMWFTTRNLNPFRRPRASAVQEAPPLRTVSPKPVDAVVDPATPSQ